MNDIYLMKYYDNQNFTWIEQTVQKNTWKNHQSSLLTSSVGSVRIRSCAYTHGQVSPASSRTSARAKTVSLTLIVTVSMAVAIFKLYFIRRCIPTFDWKKNNVIIRWIDGDTHNLTKYLPTYENGRSHLHFVLSSSTVQSQLPPPLSSNSHSLLHCLSFLTKNLLLSRL